MSKFSERFNEWLIEQGKEPVDPEIAEILNAAAKATLDDLREHKEELVKAGQFFMAELTGQIEDKGDRDD